MLKRVEGAELELIEKQYPHFIKYMGSKSKIMDFLIRGINKIRTDGALCDLFAGSASLSGAIRQQMNMHSNDIQTYSEIMAKTYLKVHRTPEMPTAALIIQAASELVNRRKDGLSVDFDYKKLTKLKAFNDAERTQQTFINQHYDWGWHYFTKTYSGTWWSAEQCLWIDALREVAEEHKSEPCYPLIISSIMYAMAYTSQGTGHYAQYRDANTDSSMKDISIYRKRQLESYFIRKFDDVAASLPLQKTNNTHTFTSLDFRECLAQFEGGMIYADPPYCIVHYSRFYHALETLVLYDNPAVQVKKGVIVKGRYRETRHQSPFCIKTKDT